MFRTTRARVQRAFRRTVRRVIGIIRTERPRPPPPPPPIEQAHVVVSGPFSHHNLIKLLRTSSPEITLLSEETVFASDPAVHPLKYFLRVQLFEPVRGQQRVKTLDVVAKVLGVNKREFDEHRAIICFKMEKEVRMYSNVVQSYDQYYMTSIFFDQKYSELFPLCYGAALSLENNFAETVDQTASILIQNLGPLGYERFREPCNFEMAKLIIKRLAQLHATPIAISLQTRISALSTYNNQLHIRTRCEKRDYGEELRRICLVITPESDMYRYINVIENHLLRYGYFDNRSYSLLVDLWNTIAHGKCSIRNMMYKPADHNGPANVKFLDPGHMEVDSCAGDLVYFMFTSIDTDVLEEYFENILDCYYTEFSRCLALAYVNAENHTYLNFRNEFLKICMSSVGGILFEIGRLHFDNNEGLESIMGISYRVKIDRVIRLMIYKCMIQL
ncbi:uncharacterized protein LOC109543199 [Dendroctonus ponderosae]|uniref:uncharacterized protein LOC109543199 n=1 Tax=Dendroctonus ponderosae TaxID=77166 RepID=UPI002034BBFF|nr:uncharacterized protein LOC109543199 [Dendroctonus ponderosae]KAH1006855.1 hypothetical protein HUJ05_007548 [Dendroctonus ponderosae]